MCFVCGYENPFGLHASFYELDSGELLGIFDPGEEHQGYPGRLHGGLASTILDETIGRAIMIEHGKVWGVTLEIHVRYRKPVPLGKDIHVLGRIDKDTHRGFQGSGEILLENGETAVEAHGKYLKLPFEQISDEMVQDEAWGVIPSEDDPDVIEIHRDVP
jgi:acyl-coenzyme A thioesterase PaaI-like protein